MKLVVDIDTGTVTCELMRKELCDIPLEYAEKLTLESLICIYIAKIIESELEYDGLGIKASSVSCLQDCEE